MHRLKKSVLKIIKENVQLRRALAYEMGVGEFAVYKSLRTTEGRSIAKNSLALMFLQNELKLEQKDIVELKPKKLKAWSK